MPAFNSVAVIGAGAWGTALASVAARAGRDVTLYARDADHAKRIATARENPRLPGIKLEADIAVTNDLAHAAKADIVLVVTPAQHLRGCDQCDRAAPARANAGDRLRQGHRARHA